MPGGREVKVVRQEELEMVRLEVLQVGLGGGLEGEGVREGLEEVQEGLEEVIVGQQEENGD